MSDTVKVASWNVNSLRVRLQQVVDWVGEAKPQILGLQETKLSDVDFPREALEALGYHVAFSGQKTYNGVALLAHQPPQDIITDLDGFEDPQRRVLAATVGDLRVWNLYVPNGKAVGTDKYEYKLGWLAALERQLAAEMKAFRDVVVIGDFNVAPTDADVHDPEAWAGKILCSEPERAALQRLLDLGLEDVFRRFEQPEKSFSWWDYRAAGFRRNHGLRIDLVLASSALAARCTASSIDIIPRRWERPSDHTPVIAEFSVA